MFGVQRFCWIRCKCLSDAYIQPFSGMLSSLLGRVCSSDVCLDNRRNVRIWQGFLALSAASPFPQKELGVLHHFFSIPPWRFGPWPSIVDKHSKFVFGRLLRSLPRLVSGTFFHTCRKWNLSRGFFLGSLLHLISISLVRSAFFVVLRVILNINI